MFAINAMVFAITAIKAKTHKFTPFHSASVKPLFSKRWWLFLSVWAGTCYPLSGLLEENKTARIKDGMIIHVSNAQTFWAELEIGFIIGLLALDLVVFR